MKTGVPAAKPPGSVPPPAVNETLSFTLKFRNVPTLMELLALVTSAALKVPDVPAGL